MKFQFVTALRTGVLGVVFTIGISAGAAPAEETGAGPQERLVSGRLGLGPLVFSRYSGGASYSTWLVPLASLSFGDYAYIDYWEAGVFLAGNEAKTLGLALVASPRVGFHADDGERLAGMMTRRTSLEVGPTLFYKTDVGVLSLDYLHDAVGASNGGTVRLAGLKRIEITDRLGVDAFLYADRLSAKVGDYYYGVREDEVSPTRPFYQPGSGVNVTAGLHFNYDFGDRSTFLFGYEGTRLAGAFADSPIVEKRLGNLFYAGYGWRL